MNNANVIAMLEQNVNNALETYNTLLDAAVRTQNKDCIDAIYKHFPLDDITRALEATVAIDPELLVSVMDETIRNFEIINPPQKATSAFDLLQNYLVDSFDALKTPDELGDLLVTPGDISAMISEARIIKHGKLEIVDDFAAEDYYNDPSWRLVRHVRLLQDDLRTAANHGCQIFDIGNYVKENYGEFQTKTRERLFEGDKVNWSNVVCLERAGFSVIHNKHSNQLNIHTTHGVLAI